MAFGKQEECISLILLTRHFSKKEKIEKQQRQKCIKTAKICTEKQEYPHCCPSLPMHGLVETGVLFGRDGRFVRWRLVFRSVETRVPPGKGLLLPNQRDAEKPEVEKIVGFRR